MSQLNLNADALGFNFLLMGAPGSGKTTEIVTLAQAGLEVFIVFTEQGVGNLKKAMEVHNLTEEERSRIHWTYVSPTKGSFSSLLKGAKAIQSAPEFGKMPAGNRKDHSQFVDMLTVCANFIDQNGVEYGAVDEWDASRVFIIDGMSGTSDMCMGMVAGDKPVKTLQDWGVAIDQLDKFVKQCANTTCCFGLLAHLEQEKDEITGRMVVTASTLGRKLGTTIGRHFQDVILADKARGKYILSTDDARIQLKHSFLKEQNALPATLVPMVESWKKENSAV